MIIKIPINEAVPLNTLHRVAMFEGMDIIIDNGKAYTIIEIFEKHDFIYR